MSETRGNRPNWMALAAVPWLAPVPFVLVLWVDLKGELALVNLLLLYLLAVAPALVWAGTMALVMWALRRRSVVLSGPATVATGAMILAVLGTLRTVLRGPAPGRWTDSPYEWLTVHHAVFSAGWVTELAQIVVTCGLVGAWCGLLLVLLARLGARTAR